jgi:hypothetical protein
MTANLTTKSSGRRTTMATGIYQATLARCVEAQLDARTTAAYARRYYTEGIFWLAVPMQRDAANYSA